MSNVDVLKLTNSREQGNLFMNNQNKVKYPKSTMLFRRKKMNSLLQPLKIISIPSLWTRSVGLRFLSLLHLTLIDTFFIVGEIN